MLARRACLEDVGLFDERYFAYCEEADLALRAAAAGWECGLVRGAMVCNPYVGSASAAIDYLQLRNTLLLVREHSGRYHAFIRYAIALWHLASGAVVPSRRGPYWNVRGRVAALADFARGRFGPPPHATDAQVIVALLGGRDARAHTHEVVAGDQQAADHREDAEEDRGDPHDSPAPRERPRPLGTMGGVEQRPQRHAERDAGERGGHDRPRPVAGPVPCEHWTRVLSAAVSPRLSTRSRSVEGRVVIVTGAASGMGRATAHLFGDEGAAVAVTDVTLEGAATGRGRDRRRRRHGARRGPSTYATTRRCEPWSRTSSITSARSTSSSTTRASRFRRRSTWTTSTPRGT